MSVMEINAFLSASGDYTVCLRRNKPISHSDLRASISSFVNVLQAHDAHNWILAANDTYNFLCGFLALLCAGKEILLPPNNQAGTLTQTIVGAQALLTDLTIDTALPTIRLDHQSSDHLATGSTLQIPVKTCFLQLCTSGSTGEPKQVRKGLATLLEEVASLEQTWGQQLGNKTIVSTVSHQHIYGLLFRVLWPLLSRRVFVCENIEYPEQLALAAQQHGQLVLISSPAYLKRMLDVLHDVGCAEQISVIFSSGGPLAAETADAYTNNLHVTPIEVLGSTETGGIAHRQQRAGQVMPWRKFAAVQIRRDNDTGALEVCSPYCYTSEWYRMGDAVELLGQDRFRLLGRLDRIIKLEEKRISLDAMEERLRAHAWLADCRLVVLDGHRTVLGAVCILSAEGAQQMRLHQAANMSRQLKHYLSDYFDRVTLPRKWRYVADFPYNSQGKITQHDLRQLFCEPVDD